MEANWITALIIGSILSIPVSILANIITPTFQKWVDKRARTVHSKSLVKLKKDYEQTKTFKEQPGLLQFTINEYIIKGLTLLCAIGIGIAYFMVLYMVDNLPLDFPFLQFLQADIVKEILMLLSLILWLFTCIYIISMIDGLGDLWIKYSQLKQFEKYEKETLEKLHELEKNIIKQAKK